MRAIRNLALAAFVAIAASACGRTIVDDWGPMGTLAVTVVDGGGARVPGATLAIGREGAPAMHTVTTAAGYDYRDAYFAGAWTVQVTPPAGYAVAPDRTREWTSRGGWR